MNCLILRFVYRKLAYYATTENKKLYSNVYKEQQAERLSFSNIPAQTSSIGGAAAWANNSSATHATTSTNTFTIQRYFLFYYVILKTLFIYVFHISF